MAHCSQTAAYIEYRHPISLHLWAALMHYQATEDRLDDVIVDQVHRHCHFPPFLNLIVISTFFSS